MVLSGTSSYHTTTRPNPTAVNSDDASTLAVQYGRIETSTRSKRMNAQSLISFIIYAWSIPPNFQRITYLLQYYPETHQTGRMARHTASHFRRRKKGIIQWWRGECNSSLSIAGAGRLRRMGECIPRAVLEFILESSFVPLDELFLLWSLVLFLLVTTTLNIIWFQTIKKKKWCSAVVCRN